MINSGYADKNGEQIYFGESVIVDGLYDNNPMKLMSDKCDRSDVDGPALLNMYWEVHYGGLPVYLEDFKKCEIVKNEL